MKAVYDPQGPCCLLQATSYDLPPPRLPRGPQKDEEGALREAGEVLQSVSTLIPSLTEIMQMNRFGNPINLERRHFIIYAGLNVFNVFSSRRQNKDGKACLLKAICEVSQASKGVGSFMEEILKTIFR